MRYINALLAGLVFGIGLIVSGMANPRKVIGFLDLAGNWDPSLALVMAGAIAVASLAFAVARRLDRSLLGGAIQWPSATRIDLRLIAGSAAFGIGWALAGFCPGPALVVASSGQPKALLFVASMLAGMGLFSLFERRSKAGPR